MTESVEAIFTAVDRAPSSAAYADAARRLRGIRQDWPAVRLALLSSFTIDLLVPPLEVETARQGFAADVYVAPFNTTEQELLGDHSGCLSHRPDVVFVARTLADVCPPLAEQFLDLAGDRVEELVDRVLADTVAMLSTFRQRSTAALVIHNFALPSSAPLGLHEVMASVSQTETIRRLNRRLVDAISTIPGAYVLDFDRACATVGYRNSHDERLWHLARAPLAPAVMRELAKMQAAFVQALVGTPRKCLVLDLDNTLWGGVVGEVGRDGIALGGPSYPGSAFRQFQLVIRELVHRGVLLAINSKNNPEDVQSVLDGHPGMVLRSGDFAATRVNWQDKPANMLEIAAELNLGIDSLVFADDSPVERLKMRQALPEVLTIEMPPTPVGFSQALLDCRAFDRVSLTSEDRRRGGMYQEQRQRTRLAASARSVEDFLRTLDMEVGIQPVEDSSFQRALDLIHKTNQFNLTTRRHPAAALRSMMADASCGVFVVQAADRFGDYGIVGVGILRTSERRAVIDTLALSCRVIGRTIETALLCHFATWARKHGVEDLEGEFVPTRKNAPAADFYPRHGFQPVNGTDGSTGWTISLRNVPFEWPAYIRSAQEIAPLAGTDA